MDSIINSIKYMTIAASLHDVNGNILYVNDIFCRLFKTCNEELISNKLSSDKIKADIISNFDVFDFINSNINNIDNLIIKIKNNDDLILVKISNLIIKNGTTFYILLYDDVTENMSQLYVYREIFNNIKKGIIVLKTKNGEEFFIKDLNPFVENIEKIDKEKLLNKNVNDISLFKENMLKIIKDVWKTGNKIEIKNVDCSKNNTQKCWRNVYIYKTFTSDIILIYEDTTETVENKLKMEEFDKQKSTFLSNMSHEIRTPINTIVGFSNLLVDCGNNKKQKEHIDIIKKSANMLTKLINDVLDITKIEAGKLDITKNTFDVNKIINELYTINKNKVEKGVKLKVNLLFNTCKIYNDEIRFRQIFNNLISNSIKYTKKGTIELGYKKEDDDIIFYVKDTGLGIKKEDYPKIFKRFERVDPTKSLGTGIGLSLSNEIVKLMGGELWFESEYNVGSTFYFKVSSKKGTVKLSKQKDTIKKSLSTITLNNKTILIVEDIDFNAKLLTSYLEETNANIIIAVDGNDALIKYNKNKDIIDLILMDIQIPNMDGNEVTRIIRTVDTEIPIIAQTAYAMIDEVPTILKNGYNDLINKPIVKEELFGVISKYI